MNNIVIPFNDKNLVFFYRDIMRETNGIEKNIDLQTIKELFDENVYRVDSSLLSGDKIVLDVGAHIGTFSIMMAALVANKVYAFEPNPDNISQLKANIAVNNFERIIEVVPYALWNREVEDIEMDYSYSDSRVNMINYLESEDSKSITPPDSRKGYKAKVITLEKFLRDKDIQEIDVLKMDIEWSEYEVIPFLSDECLAKIKYLALEFHGTDESTFGRMVAKLTKVFRLEILGSFERGGFIWGRRY